MLYYENEWFDMNEKCVIISQDKLFTVFSNGQKFATFEIEKKIKNYNEYIVERLQAKQEYIRRFGDIKNIINEVWEMVKKENCTIGHAVLEISEKYNIDSNKIINQLG